MFFVALQANQSFYSGHFEAGNETQVEKSHRQDLVVERRSNYGIGERGERREEREREEERTREGRTRGREEERIFPT